MADTARINAVVSDIVEGIRAAMFKHNVTYDEYQIAQSFLLDAFAKKDIPLLLTTFFNTTIVKIEGKMMGGSKPSLEGPYFIEDSPLIPQDGELAAREQDQGRMKALLRGRVTDLDGKPLAGATINIWHSTPDGRYSGFHDGIAPHYHRGRIITDADGRYSVRTIMPTPYQIPSDGPTGALLTAMGRHTWRPAHFHYKITALGMHTHISQAYFEGGDYVDDDCCEDVCAEHVVAEKTDDGVRIVEVDFVIPEAVTQALAA
ncbi:catechol 1,2-dioxygenase [Sphingomonas fennica]|uniref:Catechol 1,2-dioxygenase n=1 Tax=Edaphosphingomonas fennica TaxID=114404 RepID=A0A2T4HLX0_9SPHN|nr:catechol 1,2-dioxygenase [Sphingomonas fennica]PTD16803.1 catechol 1,2-dioxygenase [Sphingomonas fennica]